MSFCIAFILICFEKNNAMNQVNQLEQKKLFYALPSYHNKSTNLSQLDTFVEEVAQDSINKARAAHPNMQPEIYVGYSEFIEFYLCDFFLNGGKELDYGFNYTLIPSIRIQLQLMELHFLENSDYVSQLAQIKQCVIFTSSFLSALNITNLPEKYRKNIYEAASFIFPIPDQANYPHADYEFFIVRKK